MFRSLYRVAFFVACWGILSLNPGTADACPSCKAANATDSRLPLAYQASILFMLGVPATLVTSLGVMLYRLNKAQEIATLAFENGDVWHSTELSPSV